MRSDSYEVDWAGLPYLGLLVRSVGRGQPAPRRARLMASLFSNARGNLTTLIRSHCTSAGLLADRFGLGEDVHRALSFTFERWDGGGLPTGAREEELPIEARVAQIADVAEVHNSRYGREAAMDMIRDRSGTQFDPALVEAMTADAPAILAELDEPATWDQAIDTAPDHGVIVREAELDALLHAMGDSDTPGASQRSRPPQPNAWGCPRRTGSFSIGPVRSTIWVVWVSRTRSGRRRAG